MFSRCLILFHPVRVFQRVNDLPPNGELDEATLEVMRQPRCGMEDPFNKKLHKYRIMGTEIVKQRKTFTVLQNTFSLKSCSFRSLEEKEFDLSHLQLHT